MNCTLLDKKGFKMQEEYLFCRRKSDGRYYRGAVFWRWAKSWRSAAVFTEHAWKFVIENRDIKDEIELCTLQQVVSNEEYRIDLGQ